MVLLVGMEATKLSPGSSFGAQNISHKNSFKGSFVVPICCAEIHSGENQCQEQKQKFKYTRASPLVRWPARIPKVEIIPQQKEEDITNHVSSSKSSRKSQSQNGFNSSNNSRNSKHENGYSFVVNSRNSKCKNVFSSNKNDAMNVITNLANEICNLPEDMLVGHILDSHKDRLISLSLDDLSNILKKIGETHWQRALEVYEWLNVSYPSSRTLTTILSILGKVRQCPLAEKTFQNSRPETSTSVQVHNSMMGVYAKCGVYDKVQELLHTMQLRGIKPNIVTLNILITARFKKEKDVLTRDVLCEIRDMGLNPDVVTYNTLIGLSAENGKSEEAVEVFQDMKRNGYEPDLPTCKCLISCYGNIGMVEKATDLFDGLADKGLCPDSGTYNALLYALARNGKVEKAERVFGEMDSAGLLTHRKAYNTMIHMYGRHKMHDKAVELYRQMKCSECLPDTVTFSVLIDFLSKDGFVNEAAKIFSEMLDVGIEPALQNFRALISAHAKAEMYTEAMKTYNQMAEYGIKPDLHVGSILMNVFSKTKGAENAMDLYKDMMQDTTSLDLGTCVSLIKALHSEGKEEQIEQLMVDMHASGASPSEICSVFVEAECYEKASDVLKSTKSRGCFPSHECLITIFDVYQRSQKISEACSFVNFFYDIEIVVAIRQALVVMLARARLVETALEEYKKLREVCFVMNTLVYEVLIMACEHTDHLAEASQLYSEMKFAGVRPTPICCKSVALAYCKLGFPETAYYLLDNVSQNDEFPSDADIYVSLIEAYAKQRLWKEAGLVFGKLRLSGLAVDRNAWNALICAYAECGCYKQARAAFDQMVRDGFSPTLETINGLAKSLINGNALHQMHKLIEHIQQLGFRINRSTILLIIKAFVNAGNIPKVKKLYKDMKAAGHLPSVEIYMVLIEFFSKRKRIADAESIFEEMAGAGFKPDLVIHKAMLTMYIETDNLEKAIKVYESMKADELHLDNSCHDLLVCLYGKLQNPAEGFKILQEMKRSGYVATLNSCMQLLSAGCSQHLWQQCEELFKEMQAYYKLDRPPFHMMLKAYRDAEKYEQAKVLLSCMKKLGPPPNLATMRILMDSYGKGGGPDKANLVVQELSDAELHLGATPYSLLIDSYLKVGNYAMAIEKLLEMNNIGIKPDCRTWTCVIGAASICESTSEAMSLLNALNDTGFSLPISLMTESYKRSMPLFETVLEELKDQEEEVIFGFVNSIEDLLWAYERRATAARVFELTIQRKIYPRDTFWVKHKNWGANFRRLSPGAALVGLTLWLDLMQDASLNGVPECPNFVKLVAGNGTYKRSFTLKKTLKFSLWEMNSPFFPSYTGSWAFVAHGYSVSLWLKDSPFCMDLELKDCLTLPRQNSMQIYKGAFMRSGLVPTVKKIRERIGVENPEILSKLVLMSNEKQDEKITALVEGRKRAQKKRKLLMQHNNIKLDIKNQKINTNNQGKKILFKAGKRTVKKIRNQGI